MEGNTTVNENLATVGLIDKLGPFLTSEPTLPTSEPELDPDADGSNLRVRLVRATRTLSVLTDNMRVTMHRVDR
jgi:hypothetical protein